MESVMRFRIDAPTFTSFCEIAQSEDRSPSNLARKLLTDFVRGRQLHAVPPTAAVQLAHEAPQAQSSTPSPWDI